MPTARERLIEQLKQDREDAAVASAAAASASWVVGGGAGAPQPQGEEEQQPPPDADEVLQHPKVSLQIATQIKDKSSRDRALLKALKESRHELDEATAANSSATERLSAAKEAYNLCANLLSGYAPLEARLAELKRARAAAIVGGGGVAYHAAAKRIKVEAQQHGVTAAEAAAMMQQQQHHHEGAGTEISSIVAAAASIDPSAYTQTAPSVHLHDGVRHHFQPEYEIILPTNDMYLPEYYTAGGGMDESTVAQHREAFYQYLTKGQAGAADIDDWNPPPNNANLKSKAQLSEWIHIATHWNTGADGLDAGAFRAKHKTWYSRMKPVTANLGRRTGIHLRQLDMVQGEYHGEDGRGMTVLCRYNKAGNKSIVYLDVGRLFDALFQIHAIELSHRGRDATKNLADERYANIPDNTVRAFLDTCPACSARKGYSRR